MDPGSAKQRCAPHRARDTEPYAALQFRPMNKFTYDSSARVRKEAPDHPRPGQPASVFGVFLPQDRVGSYFDQFAPGVVYSIEYEDGEAADVHEDFLENL
jgi:hypothetical protein